MADDADPIRAETHQLEELSERFFRASMPRNWVCERPSHDYGVDLRVDLFADNNATGLELLVQLKSAAKPTGGDTEVIRVRTATYNYLRDKLQTVMLVKFVESEDEAYSLLLRDIPEPTQEQETFSVHIPRANRLSIIPWAVIQEHVRSVTDTKLAAMRRAHLQAAPISVKADPVQILHPPVMPQVWVSRPALLKEIEGWWRNGSENVLVLLGMGGSGKSTLANEWVQGIADRRAGSELDGLVQFSFYEHGDRTFRDFLVATNRALV